MSKLLIVDGHNLLFQMFYGMPSRIINSKGRAIQGTLGFVGALLKIIRMTSPTHVVILFDGECENIRVGLDADYKSNRPDYSEMDWNDVPFSQLPDIYAALDYLGIKYWETTCCESDDVIASYALRFGAEHQVVISSFDSDFFQLINDNVSVLRYRGDNTVMCDREYIREKFGIETEMYAHFKSLTGDSADNIKGINKIGPKTAAWLVNEYGTVDQIIENADKIEKTSVRRSVCDGTERLKLNYSLIKLTDSADLPFEMNELEYHLGNVTTNQILLDIGVK